MGARDSQAESVAGHDRQTLLQLIRKNVDGLVVVDPAGRILFANPAAAGLFGRSQEALTGTLFGAPVAGETAAEVEIIRRDEPIAVELRSVEIDWGGEPATLVSLRDITDRKRAEEQLEAVTDRLKLALASSRAGIWSWSPAEDRLEVDPFVTSLLERPDGRPPETLDELLEQVVPDHRERLGGRLREIFHAARDFVVDLPVRRPDGSIRHLEARGSVQLDAVGEPVRLLGICWDATERLGLEEQLRQAQKMEAVGHLAGGVAHDFNNLLTGISGYTRLVRERLPETSQEREDLARVLQLANRGAELIQQLLAFSRQTQVELELIDVNDVVRDTMQLLGRVLGDDIEIRLGLAAAGSRVRGDARRIEQVLVNLAINARDAMPDGGVLTIESGERVVAETPEQSLSDLSPGRYTFLSVTDTGTGMTEEVKTRIFEPFFTTKEVGEGSGLGLSTVFGIVRQHEGVIDVTSAPGEGTSFDIYLPAAEPTTADQVDTEAGGERPVRVASPGDETVLVVEDDGAVAEVARRILERHGYRTLVTTDPGKAVDLFDEHAVDVDLVLLDVVMPRHDGPAIYAEIAARKPEVKVLFMSGYFDVQGQLKGPLIEKPFMPGQLARRVREVLDSPA